MLVILLPDQIVKHWDELRYYIESSMPIHKKRKYDMAKIIMHIIGGVLLVTCLKDKDGSIIAVFTLTVVRDKVTGINSLEIMTGYAVRMLVKEEIDNIMKTVYPLARDKGCTNVLFYTDSEQVIDAFKQGGAIAHTYLMWEV